MGNLLAIEPEIVYAGSTIAWKKSFPDYPFGTYTLRYEFAGPGTISDITSTQDGDNPFDHDLSVTAATSASWAYGIYSWRCYAEKGALLTLERYFLGSGFLTVKTATGKSFNQTMFEAIQSILLGRATNKDLDIVRKTLGSTSIDRESHGDMLRREMERYEDKWKAEINREMFEQRKRPRNRILHSL